MTASDKVYEDYALELPLDMDSRQILRERVVNAFLAEKAGFQKDGKTHVTRYKYYVETLRDGRRLFLVRPTFLNKGIDFQVWVERLNGSEDGRPSHKHVLEDLRLKKRENITQFPLLLKAVDMVWNCKRTDEVMRAISVNFKQGLTMELLLKILKWLFIEQDVTYWNYTGRGMLQSAILGI